MTANSIDIAHVYDKGLEPLDFIKHTLPCEEEDVDKLAEMNMGFERMGLEPTHLYEVLGPEDLDKLCYQREGKIPSFISYRARIAGVLDIPEEFIPEGLVEAQLVLSREQSYGKRSYKNFLRRIKRETKANALKIRKRQDSKFKMHTADPGNEFVLKWD